LGRSNTVGFPKAENLFQKGATDGERFKRYARQSMAPTPFWYSAFLPHLAALAPGMLLAIVSVKASSDQQLHAFLRRDMNERLHSVTAHSTVNTC